MIGIGFLAASALAEAGLSASASKAEVPCRGIACVMKELPACWGNTSESIGTGQLSGKENMPLLSGQVICLKNGRVTVQDFQGDEGFGGDGTYRLLGNKMAFTVDDSDMYVDSEGWGALFGAGKVTCKLSLTATKQLLMKSCSDGREHEPYDIGKK